MFVRKETLQGLLFDIERLEHRIERLEHKQLKHGKGIGKLYEKIDSTEKDIENLQEHVGTRRGFRFFNIDIIKTFYDPIYTTKREAKSFSLTEKIDAIMGYLGLKEEVSAETKLVKVPATKKKGTK